MSLAPKVEKKVMPSATRSLLLVACGLGLIGLMALLAPKIGAIGVGTLIALGVAIAATRTVLQGRDDQL